MRPTTTKHACARCGIHLGGLTDSDFCGRCGMLDVQASRAFEAISAALNEISPEARGIAMERIIRAYNMRSGE